MKVRMQSIMLGVLLLAAAGGATAAEELFRCRQENGSVAFQQMPCPVTDRPPPEQSRPISMPAPVQVPTPPAAQGEDAWAHPTRRRREILELSAQLERCRQDMPGFAEKSAAIQAAWNRRHASVLAGAQKLLALKVRAGRSGEATLPLRMCTDDWLQALEPLTRAPDARFQTVEKTWQVFLGALMTGDRSTAMNCLAGRAEARWKERTARMSEDDLRRIGATIRALKVQWGDDYEKEGLVADTENRVVGIAFRNVNEEWKITELGGAPATPLPAN
jgi:hypothetical protein